MKGVSQGVHVLQWDMGVFPGNTPFITSMVMPTIPCDDILSAPKDTTCSPRFSFFPASQLLEEGEEGLANKATIFHFFLCYSCSGRQEESFKFPWLSFRGKKWERVSLAPIYSPSLVPRPLRLIPRRGMGGGGRGGGENGGGRGEWKGEGRMEGGGGGREGGPEKR